MFQPTTPLEEEIAAVLRGSSHVIERTNKELTEEEEQALLAMDLEEVQQFFLKFFIQTGWINAAASNSSDSNFCNLHD